MKEKVFGIGSAFFIFLLLCTVTSIVIRENMVTEVDTVNIEKVESSTGELLRIPACCIVENEQGVPGFFCMEETDGLWGKEWQVRFNPAEVTGDGSDKVLVQSTQRRIGGMIVGYSSRELKDEETVRKVQK
ncbi:hypothetical protein NXH76_18770 [Blautia schinkii]|nr:hypothetical protein [Blautia schinkii]